MCWKNYNKLTSPHNSRLFTHYTTFGHFPRFLDVILLWKQNAAAVLFPPQPPPPPPAATVEKIKQEAAPIQRKLRKKLNTVNMFVSSRSLVQDRPVSAPLFQGVREPVTEDPTLPPPPPPICSPASIPDLVIEDIEQIPIPTNKKFEKSFLTQGSEEHFSSL